MGGSHHERLGLEERVIYVAGHTGLAGSAIVRALGARGARRIVTRTHAELELRDPREVERFFSEVQPEMVVVAAAKVGGIAANAARPAEFITENLAIQFNVFEAARAHGVDRVVFLGSSCIYPREAAQPIRESALLTGPLELTNRPYAVAKIAGIEQLWAYNRQYGCRYLALMPTNLYGPGDSYHPEDSHVLPALLRRFDMATVGSSPVVTVWGSGRPMREFLYSDDLGEAVAFVLSSPNEVLDPLFDDREPPLLNVGFGRDITIRDLAALIADATGYQGATEWDAGRPDGTPRKLLDSARIRALGWKPAVELEDGLRRALADYRQRFRSAGSG